MDEVLHKVFKTVVKDILQDLPRLKEYGAEVSYFISEPRNFAEVTKFSNYKNKPSPKTTMKEIRTLINNRNFLVEYPEKFEPVTPCMDVYKAKTQYDGILETIKLRIVLRGDLHNTELFGDTWSPTASMMTLKYFLADTIKHKSRVHQLDFFAAFLQAKVKNGVFVNLDSRYTYYFPEYSK